MTAAKARHKKAKAPRAKGLSSCVARARPIRQHVITSPTTTPTPKYACAAIKRGSGGGQEG
eukprot:359649-Prorocentrum_minimum.AAC.1